jgi:hypothetical protein
MEESLDENEDDAHFMGLLFEAYPFFFKDTVASLPRRVM